MTGDSGLIPFAALLATVPFWGSAALKAVFFRQAVSEVAGLGLRPARPVAILVIAVQAIGSALVILNLWPLWGIGLLAGFTLAATGLGHAFWRQPAGRRMAAANGFLANIGLLGGLLAVAVLYRSS